MKKVVKPSLKLIMASNLQQVKSDDAFRNIRFEDEQQLDRHSDDVEMIF